MTEQTTPPEQLTWIFRPLKGRAGVVVFLAVLFPVLGGAVFLESGSAALTVLAIAFVGVAISPAILPTGYVLNEDGVAVRHAGRTTQQPWQAFRRLIVDRDVVLLSRFVKPSFLDTFRGQYLRFNRDQEILREKAIRFVLARLPARQAVDADGSSAPEAEKRG